MSEGIDQANQNQQGQQNNADNREQMTQAQDQVGQRGTQNDGATQDFRGMGETGSSDLGDFGTQPGGHDETVGSAGGQAQGEEVGDGSAIGGAWNNGEPQEGQPAERDVEDAIDDDAQEDIGDGAGASSAGGGY